MLDEHCVSYIEAFMKFLKSTNIDSFRPSSVTHAKKSVARPVTACATQRNVPLL